MTTDRSSEPASASQAGPSDSRASAAGPGLAVNAAFLKDIKDDNRHLKELLDRIGELTGQMPIAKNHWNELIRLAGDLTDQLAFHFSLEEAYGYFDEAIGADPMLSAKAEVLRAEHAKLFAWARDLADRMSETAPEHEAKLEAAVQDYQSFYQAFTRHEEAELKIILGSIEDDPGGGD